MSGAVADYGNGSSNLDYQISGATVTFSAALDNGAKVKVKVKYGYEI